MRSNPTAYWLSFVQRLLKAVRVVAVMLSATTAYHLYVFRITNKHFEGLNLGCGGSRIRNYCNIDASPSTLCDIVAPVDRIKVSSESVGAIYSSHLLEHIHRARAKGVLSEWYRVLKPGGKLYLCVPDEEVLFRIYLDNLPHYDTEQGKYLVDRACYLTYGGQANRYDFHFYGYSFATLRDLLQSVGFRNVQRFDRSHLDISLPQDISVAQVDSFPMSLNVEASK